MGITQGRPGPEDYQPALAWWGHLWRTVVMLAISVVVWLTIAESQSEALLLLDLALGVPSVVLVFFRRRWPVAVTVLTTVLSIGSSLAAGPATLALVSLVTRRRWVQVLTMAVLSLVCAALFTLLNPPTRAEPLWLTMGSTIAFIAAATAWGLYLGSRRELIWTLKNRAERAEAEQELRIAQSRLGERSRIAREMHDVLAHRISQISLHAGALGFRDDLTADEMRASAAVIREKAHEALTDLRGVLGVLRDSSGELLHTPQPTYDDLAGLVAEARRSGLKVGFVDHVVRPREVPEASGRTLYRIIQEGITNARKHAPGALLTIELSGSPDDGIDVTLSNPIGFGSTTTPGAGLGLVGLSERAELRGGRLEHRREGSAFILRGWIPWAA